MGLWQRLKSFFTGDHFSEEVWEEWEDLLVEGDMGYQNAQTIVSALREKSKAQRWKDPSQLKEELVSLIQNMVKTVELEFSGPTPHVILFLGVNGVGKTTNLAKLANWYHKEKQKKIVLAAGDTFRAAAIEQLSVWGQRLGVRVVHQGAKADPAAVIFDAITSASSKNEDMVLADTAGRLHNKTQLVNELAKINKVILNKIPSGSYRKVLVIDTVTGQNAVEQAEVFHQAVGVDAILLSKWDSSAKGGPVLSITQKLGIGVAFVGVGEKLTDLAPFNPRVFAEEIVGS